MTIVALFGGAGAWAVSEHGAIEARAEARVLRSEDRVGDRLDSIERKIDLLTEILIGR